MKFGQEIVPYGKSCRLWMAAVPLEEVRAVVQRLNDVELRYASRACAACVFAHRYGDRRAVVFLRKPPGNQPQYPRNPFRALHE